MASDQFSYLAEKGIFVLKGEAVNYNGNGVVIGSHEEDLARNVSLYLAQEKKAGRFSENPTFAFAGSDNLPYILNIVLLIKSTMIFCHWKA